MKIVIVVVVVVVVVIFKCVPETIMRSLPDINIHSIYCIVEVLTLTVIGFSLQNIALRSLTEGLPICP